MHERLRNLILDILRAEDLPSVDPVLREIPFEGQLGLALSNVFQIAREAKPDADKKALKAYANELADLIAGKIDGSGEFGKVESVRGYVNCFFKPDIYARELVGRILSGKTDWAKGDPAEWGGGKVMIEYSQPNTHKAFHIGHVRNVVTGAALVRCFRYAGRDTLAANYYGDIGSHVFKLLWYLEEFDPNLEGAPDDPAELGKWLGRIYAKADGLLENSRELENKVWDILKPLSSAMEDLWNDDALTESLEIDPLVRRIAIKEEDLFENRASEQVTELIEKIYKASLKLHDAAQKKGILPGNGETETHIAALEEYIRHPEFDEVWSRPKRVLDVAERWYRDDGDLVDLWKKTRQWSFDDFNRIYSELDAVFDIDFLESEVEEQGLEIVSEMQQKGIVTESSGAKIIGIDKMLEEHFGVTLKGKEQDKGKYRVMVLVRADGASLYGAKDLALAKRKFKDYGIDESIYVVGNEQKFYFQQLFQILRLMGFEQWEKCFHLSYELVMLPHGKISSRKGHVVLYDDVIDELRNRAFDVVNEKNPDLDEAKRREISEMVAMGALIYGMLRVDTNKKIVFKFDEVLDFDGRSAPYIQYACARANSIFRKAETGGIEIPDSIDEADFTGDLMPVEIDLLGLLGRFPDIVKKVVNDKKPIHVASYAYDLAVKFSDFYHQCPVLTAESNVRRNRMLLVKAVRITLEASLGLLGISAPDVM